jgi:ring-1,2-phenylacetyl-CoA epoxidase subunit PaaE
LYQALTIEHIIDEAGDFKVFVFKDARHIRYRAGQFLTFVHATGHEEIRRSYSIISAPDLSEPLSIGVKRIANGIFSRKLIDETRVGDTLYTTGAAGFFCLPENIGLFSTVFFFAAGSGIAPVYSLIKTALHKYPFLQLRLIYSNQSVHTTVFYQQLRQLELQYKNNLRIHFLFSSLSDLSRARLNRELLLEFLATNRCDRNKTLFYTCGPAAYMRMIIYHLQEQGFPQDHIKKEDFNPRHAAMSKAKPPDTGTHDVILKMNGKDFRVTVKYPETILKAAQREKISLPYSCETGKCGSCAARCLQGTVWLSYNEVLTGKELAAGLTLTCTGHPVTDNVILQMDKA